MFYDLCSLLYYRYRYFAHVNPKFYFIFLIIVNKINTKVEKQNRVSYYIQSLTRTPCYMNIHKFTAAIIFINNIVGVRYIHYTLCIMYTIQYAVYTYIINAEFLHIPYNINILKCCTYTSYTFDHVKQILIPSPHWPQEKGSDGLPSEANT